MQDLERLDFDADLKKIPASWFELRGEPVPIFKQLKIFEAHLSPLDLEKYSGYPK